MGRQASFLIILLALGLTSCHQSTSVAVGTGAGATGNGMSAQSNGGSAAANHNPLTDLPGITSEKDLASVAVVLKPADVQFYIKNMQATLDRYQHPTPKDLADIAEAKRLNQVALLALSKMGEDMKAGNTQKAMNEDMFHPTPEQQATMDRGGALSYDGVAEIVAKDAGMPGGQWLAVCKAVEFAAGVDAGVGIYGSAGDSPTSNPTPEQVAFLANRRRITAADQALVAPNAPEIKRLHGLVMQAASDRQANLTQ
jgi:hypothetical protein